MSRGPRRLGSAVPMHENWNFEIHVALFMAATDRSLSAAGWNWCCPRCVIAKLPWSVTFMYYHMLMQRFANLLRYAIRLAHFESIRSQRGSSTLPTQWCTLPGPRQRTVNVQQIQNTREICTHKKRGSQVALFSHLHLVHNFCPISYIFSNFSISQWVRLVSSSSQTIFAAYT